MFLTSRRRATSLLTAAGALAVVAGAPSLVEQHGGTAHSMAAEASLQAPLNANTTHLALPFEIPQLQLPAPKLSSEHGAGPEYSPLSSIGANPQHHAGAPVPQPFDVSYLTGYVSDVSSYRYGIYYEVVREFKDLRSNHPEVMQKNLDIVAEYNNNAQQERVDKAIRDALADKDGVLFTAAEALGDEFGRHFLAALHESGCRKPSSYWATAMPLARVESLAGVARKSCCSITTAHSCKPRSAFSAMSRRNASCTTARANLSRLGTLTRRRGLPRCWP